MTHIESIRGVVKCLGQTKECKTPAHYSDRDPERAAEKLMKLPIMQWPWIAGLHNVSLAIQDSQVSGPPL